MNLHVEKYDMGSLNSARRGHSINIYINKIKNIDSYAHPIWFQEFKKHDKKPDKYIKQWSAIKPKTGVPYTIDIGYERFLGPEVSNFC
jgi:hypothetical protein